MIPADPIEQAAQAGKALEAMLKTEKLLRAWIKRLEAALQSAHLTLSGLRLRFDGDKVARENAVARIEAALGKEE